MGGSKLPWRVGPRSGGVIMIKSNNEGAVCAVRIEKAPTGNFTQEELNARAEANAMGIVAAVNSHKELMAAMKEGLACLEVAVYAGGADPVTHTTCVQMRRAIENAKRREQGLPTA